MESHIYADGIDRQILLTNTSALFTADEHTYVNVFHAIEIAIILITSISSLVALYLGCTIRAAHPNLVNILHLYEILYFPFAMARFVLIMVERRIFIFTGDLSDDAPLLYCGIVHGWFLTAHTVKVPAMLCERLFASYLVGDYEKERRMWISTILIFAILTSAFTMTIMTYYNLGSYYACIIPALILQALSVMAFLYIRYQNTHLDRQLQSKVDYTLSRKFQVAENWKILRLVRIKLVATVIIVTFCCVMFWIVMIMTNPVSQASVCMILQLCFSGFPLIINITIIYSFEAWRKKFLPSTRKRDSRTPELSQQQMGDIYFAQIESAWK